jgi:hypothetical protein
MPATARSIDVYLEIADKRAFAGGIEWPGWCRRGRDGSAALEALVASGPRYAKVVSRLRPAFHPPATVEEVRVRERLAGDATTNFGAPGIAPKADNRAVNGTELRRQLRILRACWTAFDRAVELADGAKLAKGPRGGGRSLEAIVGHVVGAEAGYVRLLAWKPPRVDDADPGASLEPVREAVVEALDHAVREGVPATGPKGGKMWTARYFLRRDAWHALDHAWEIEDRTPAAG